VAAIAAGVYHLCAIRGTGESVCLGSIFSAVEAPSPFDTSVLAGRARQLVSGADFSCALTVEGVVECWGDNSFGQLGDPSIPTGGPFRVERAGADVIAIGAGEYTVCALTAEGGVTCWGDTSFGQLGDGTARWR
jgi:alpha-tubulin suppressor-like RCC1 family protein